MNRPTDSIDDKIDFDTVIADLTWKERRAALLFIEGYTPDEIGSRLGITGRQVYAILKNLEIHFN